VVARPIGRYLGGAQTVMQAAVALIDDLPANWGSLQRA
jgi:hypothetical protein